MNGVKIRVRYYETDKSMVVHHSNFISYFEVARTEFLRNIGISYRKIEEKGIFLVVTETGCKYFSNGGYDDEISINVKLSWIKHASLCFNYEAYLENKLIAQGYTVLASVSTARKPVRFPSELRETLLKAAK